MKTWTDFLPLVLPDVPGCPEGMAEDAIKLTATDFLRRTQGNVSTVTLTIQPPGATTYEPWIDAEPWDESAQWIEILGVAPEWQTIPETSGHVLADILTIKLAGEEGVATPFNVDSDCGMAAKFDGRSLRMALTRSADVAVVADVVTIPGPAALGVTDWVFDHYGEVIAHGALMRLQAKPSKPWTDASTAAFNSGEYERKTNAAAFRIGATRQHRARRLRVRPA